MKLAFVADVHLANHRVHGGPVVAGLNARARGILASLRAATKEAADEDALALVVLGDLFDSHRPEPQLEAGAAAALTDSGEHEVHLIVGNHDITSGEPGDNAMAPLAFVPRVVVHESLSIRCFSDLELWFVPYRAGVAKDWLPGVLRDLEASRESWTPGRVPLPPKHRVLALHLGVHDSAARVEFFWAEAAHDAISAELLADLCFEHRIDAALAGNWHGLKRWQMQWPEAGFATEIVQVGALVPTGWDNPGLDGYGSVAVYDSAQPPGRRVRATEIPGARFISVSSAEELDDALLTSMEGSALYVRWAAEQKDAPAAIGALDSQRARLAAGEVRIQGKATNAEAAHRAAGAARASETLTGAVERYVAAMSCPDDVRADVLARVMDYLSKGIA